MFSDDSWDRRDAQVVCTMLGFSPSGARATLDSAFGQVEATFIMDEVNCTGEESSLEQCPHNTVHDCGSYEGAGVICAPADNSTNTTTTPPTPTPPPPPSPVMGNSSCICGISGSNKIVGGEEAKVNEFPWQVALVDKGGSRPW